MTFDPEKFVKKYSVPIANKEEKKLETEFDPESFIKKMEGKPIGRQERAFSPEAGIAPEEFKESLKRTPGGIDEMTEVIPGVKVPKIKLPSAKKTAGAIAKSPLLRSLSSGATLGASEPIAAGLSSVILKGLYPELFEEIKSPTGEVLREAKGIGDIYGDVRGRQKEELEEMQAKSPIKSTIGEIAGLATPSGAFGQIYKGAKAATKLPAAAKLPTSLRALQMGTRGGLAGAGAGAVEALTGAGDVEDIGQTAELGALFDALGVPIGRGIRKGFEGVRKGIKTGVLPGAIDEALEKIPGLRTKKKIAEEDARQAWEAGKADLEAQYTLQEAKKKADLIMGKKKAVEDFKGLITKEPDEAAESFLNTVRKADRELGRAYDEAVSPIMKANKDAMLDTAPFKNRLDDIFESYGVLDEGGRIDYDEIKGILDPDISSFLNKLGKFREGLPDRYSLKNFEGKRRQLQKIAKFGKGEGMRTESERMLGDISRSAKDTINDQLQDIVGPQGKQVLMEAKQIFAQQKPLFQETLRLSNIPVKRLAPTLRSKPIGSRMGEMAEVLPETRDDLGDLFLNMLTQHSVAPRKFTKEIDYMGRDLLEDILGSQKMRALEGAEKQLHSMDIPYAAIKSARPTPIPFQGAPVGESYNRLLRLLERRLAAPVSERGASFLAPAVGDQI